MSEYINKADILGFIRKMERSRYLKNDSVITDTVLSTTECIKKFVSTMSSADVQPVVRCKDCIYSEMTTDGYCKYCQYLANEFDVIDAVYFDGNDFCSHGKRKGADNG